MHSCTWCPFVEFRWVKNYSPTPVKFQLNGHTTRYYAVCSNQSHSNKVLLGIFFMKENLIFGLIWTCWASSLLRSFMFGFVYFSFICHLSIYKLRLEIFCCFVFLGETRKRRKKYFPYISYYFHIPKNFDYFFYSLEKIGIDEKVICYHNISN